MARPGEIPARSEATASATSPYWSKEGNGWVSLRILPRARDTQFAIEPDRRASAQRNADEQVRVLSLARMRSSTPANCQSCGAAIIWATMASGKLSPFQLDVDGAWTIGATGAARYTGAPDKLPSQRSLELEQPTPRYTNHFATCPQAAEWRQR